MDFGSPSSNEQLNAYQTLFGSDKKKSGRK